MACAFESFLRVLDRYISEGKDSNLCGLGDVLSVVFGGAGAYCSATTVVG